MSWVIKCFSCVKFLDHGRSIRYGNSVHSLYRNFLLENSRRGSICLNKSYIMRWANPGARGEHLTSQLSWVPACLLVTRVFLVYLVYELVLVFLVLLKEWRCCSQKVYATPCNGCMVWENCLPQPQVGEMYPGLFQELRLDLI